MINGWENERDALEFQQFMRTRETADERQAAFMIYATDKNFSRHDLCRSLKELGYDDGNFEKEPCQKKA